MWVNAPQSNANATGVSHGLTVQPSPAIKYEEKV